MRTLKFTKMQGAGNDFVMLDGIRQDIEPTPAPVSYTHLDVYKRQVIR